MNLGEKIMQAIENYIAIYVPKYLEGKTSLCEKKTAKIKTVLGNNKYMINLNGKDYTVNSKFTFTANETVYILKKFGEIVNAEDVYILPNS